jgi:NADH-quinone oxidoreductase subunit C
LVGTNLIEDIVNVFKNHHAYQFKMLTCISGVDFPKNLYRFAIVYELLSLKYNSRLRLKVLANESTPVKTIEKVHSSATWYEAEIWDMFGVFFINQYNLTRLLTDYGFQGYPLRKDFPLTGFLESRYNLPKDRVGYEDIELAQEFRIFLFTTPWEKVI